jgi:tripartite-type tricarboxylate transporter receptor subunit TctC
MNIAMRAQHPAGPSSSGSFAQAFRSILLSSSIVALTVAAHASAAAAQADFPVRPVRFIVPFPPGAINDYIARALSPRLGEAWGQQVVVDNRPGGGTIIGTELGARAAPDGHTLLLGSLPLATNPSVYPKLPYDVLRDLAPVCLVGSSPYILVVHPTLPVKTTKEFVALAKAKPGTLTYGSTGIGGTSHLMGELLKAMAGIDIVHVPYKGQAPAMNDLFGNKINFTFGSYSTVAQHLKTGRIRAIAVTSAKRAQSTPELPTIAESGYPGYEAIPWFGVLLPARTPRALVVRIHDDIVKILQLPEFTERFATQGLEIAGSTPEQFADFIRVEINRWEKIVKAAGVKPE